jgi:predicted component of type VI protein secretion system
MAKLILKFNEEVIDHIEITQGDMKIGRKPSCDVFLDNLAVSGEHANIFTIGEDSFVQDLGSTNGSFVNNKKITKHHLKSGDVISIGKHTMIYYAESQGKEEHTEDFAKTVIINPDPAPAKPVAPPKDFAKETMAPGASKKKIIERQGAIFVLNGANSGRRLDLNKSVTNLGKAGKVSGAITRTSDGGYQITSGNSGDGGPKLNGRDVPPGNGAMLKNGDIIEVSGTRLQFYLK